MKLSVIIPVFNGEKTIERCINSALSQTVSDFEIIVVNDGSNDKTTDIIEQIKDSRVKVITQQNSGQGLARNAGLDAAKGEYIGFLDADDTIENGMYEKMYAAASEHNADIVQCNLTDIYADGRSVTQLSDFEGLAEVKKSAEYMSRYMAGYIHSYEVCNKIFRRDFLERNNLRFKDTRKYFSEDILFNMEAVKCLPRVFFIKEPYYNYYQNSDSHMHTGRDRLNKMLDLFDDYISEADSEMKISASYLAAMVTMYNIGECNGALPQNAVKRLKEYIKNAKSADMPLKKRLYLTAAGMSGEKIILRLAKVLNRG